MLRSAFKRKLRYVELIAIKNKLGYCCTGLVAFI